MRKNHRQEAGALPGAPARLENAGRRGAAMMPIGNVEKGNAGEFLLDPGDGRVVGDDPGTVTHPILGEEVDARFFREFLGEEFIQARHRAVGEERRTRLCFQRLDVPHAVIFLVDAGQFMFLDPSGQVLRATGRCRQTYLTMGAQDLRVQVEARSRILPQRSIADPFLKILPACRVNLRVGRIRCGRQINFRFADVQKT